MIIPRGVARGGQGGQSPSPSPPNLAHQLTLFKPGGQIVPLTLLPAPLDSKSYLHLWSLIFQTMLDILTTGFWGLKEIGKFLWEFSHFKPKVSRAKFIWKIQKKIWYYEKWVGHHASFPPRRSFKNRTNFFRVESTHPRST